jgi:hypothetical protein
VITIARNPHVIGIAFLCLPGISLADRIVAGQFESDLSHLDSSTSLIGSPKSSKRWLSGVSVRKRTLSSGTDGARS